MSARNPTMTEYAAMAHIKPDPGDYDTCPPHPGSERELIK